VRCLGVCFSSVLPLRSYQNLPCASWRLMFSVFSYDFSITPSMSMMCASELQYIKKRLYKTSELPSYQPSNPVSNLVKTDGCQPQSRKTNWNLDQNNVHAFVRRWAPSSYILAVASGPDVRMFSFFPLSDSSLMMNECSYSWCIVSAPVCTDQWRTKCLSQGET